VVQDLDSLKLNYTFRSQDHWTPAFKSTLHKYQHRVNSQTPTHKADTEDKSTEIDFSKLASQLSATNVKVMDILLPTI